MQCIELLLIPEKMKVHFKHKNNGKLTTAGANGCVHIGSNLKSAALAVTANKAITKHEIIVQWKIKQPILKQYPI